ncbi:Hpt domain-containing protein [Candidatus Comchoanobacter bicostacola]|uniref:Hpt domain-containing protein n=1 Tax=Candidatus Comchoanobacter bicostacola TaxID=2919598 RepID=A0ABY5DK30_9GAMM|nr:Hpt domain-containing protein [Candidatus Comchoanobacter bicostacola]UTC24221.1 Hpt domain-containing protein [Candidatus Comchoanobacter bicostacola]
MHIENSQLIALYGNLGSAQPIIDLFIKNSPELIKDLEKCIMLNAHSQLDDLCHKLIGQSRYIACKRIEEIAELLPTKSNIEKLNLLDELKIIISEIKHEHS